MPKNMQSFMKFQQELERREIPKQTAYMLTKMYEQMLNLAEQVDMCANLILKTVESMDQVVNLNSVTQDRMKELKNFGKEDGIDVESVANDPEDEQKH